MALVFEGMDAAPDEYRRAFALALALERLPEAAQSNMTKAMLHAASGLDMRTAALSAFMQAGQSPPT